MPGFNPAPPTTTRQLLEFAQDINAAVTALGEDYLGGRPTWVGIVLLPRQQICGHSVDWPLGNARVPRSPSRIPIPQGLALTSLHWATVRSPSTASTMQSATAAVTDNLISLGAEREVSGPAPTESYGASPRRESLVGERDARPWHPEGHPGHALGSGSLSVCCQSRKGSRRWLEWEMLSASPALMLGAPLCQPRGCACRNVTPRDFPVL